MLRVFVTGTDTGVGKTEVACALLSLLADAGLNPAPFKPYESGCEDLAAPEDAVALKAAARSDDDLALVCPHRFHAPLAPGVAASRLGQRPSFKRTMQTFHRFDGRSIVVEGAGGLLVPIDARRNVLDLIAALGLPVLLVARAGLGTLNHTGLSLSVLFDRHIPVRAVLLSCGTSVRDLSERDNAAWIGRLFNVRVLGPVGYQRNGRRRREAFRHVLRPLLAKRRQTEGAIADEMPRVRLLRSAKPPR